MGLIDNYKPAMGMIFLQFTYAGVALFTRAALVEGLSPRIYVVYRQGIAFLCIAPIAYLSRRRYSSKSSLGLKGFGWIFLASLIGVTGNQNAYFEGLYLSSSTMASAMTNMIPAITFVMATICGLEKVNLRSLRSNAKIVGTIICVGGAISMVLLKGPKLLNSPNSLFNQESDHNWLMGCLFLLASSFFWSFWMIAQVPISDNCPDHLYTSAWMCFLATLQSATIALISEKDLNGWNLRSTLQLWCCLYAGIALAVSFFIQAWCISQRGPLFSALFNPLCTVIVSIIAALFMHEQTYIGSLFGALAVIIGLYVVLWGKAKDLEEKKQEVVQTLMDDHQSCKIFENDIEEPLLFDKSRNNV